jgi:hypothetical protein
LEKACFVMGVIGKDRKLVTAQSRDDIAAPKRLLQQNGHVDESEIACGMAQRIVDVFETVEVHGEEEHRFSCAPSQYLLLATQDEKPTTIGYMREIVLKRKGSKSFDQTLPVDGIADRSE